MNSETGASGVKGLHFAMTVCSESNAKKFFEELLGLGVVKEFDLDDAGSRALFEMDGAAKVIVYAAGPVTLEVFVSPERAGGIEKYDHVCLAVPDRAGLIERAEKLGLRVTKLLKSDREIVFIRDFDGNMYEIKEM